MMDLDKIDNYLEEGYISAKSLEGKFKNFKKDTMNYFKAIDSISSDVQAADNAVGGTSMIRDNNIVTLKGQAETAIVKYIGAVEQVALEYKNIEKEK